MFKKFSGSNYYNKHQIYQLKITVNMVKISFLASLMLLMFSSCHSRAQNNSELNQSPKIEVIASASDSLIFYNLMDTMTGKEFEPDEVVLEVAKYFLETPYVASTLEADGEEKLVVNLREMDCTTYVEYVLAASRCIRTSKTQFDDFAFQLATLRYRNGTINGYPSRLHYFSDWLHDNQKKGVLDIISDQIGDSIHDVNVDFMTHNRHFYKQLLNDGYFAEIAAMEKEMSTYTMKYVSKSKIEDVANLIYNGDVIAMVTSIAGLDVSHVGLAIHVNGRLHLIHASTDRKSVV